jgi:beta-N-acetylhexosaminidase
MAQRARPRAAIVGIAGPTLLAEEIELFRSCPPAGLILFARNVQSPQQMVGLTQAARELLGAELPILVDQEGGRVARLGPPHWPQLPPASAFEGLPAEAAQANASQIGLMCQEVGIDVVCAPVLDIRVPTAHAVIGDRAFSAAPEEVARLGAACMAGLQQAGCVPVMKHIPGHGRATVDSHLALPVVDAARERLAEDWAPFAALAGLGAWAMTAHIRYPALDAEAPATLSHRIVHEVIRWAIGFGGLLITDDLAMRALAGPADALAVQAIGAGCDLALHCTGVLAETAAVLGACPPLTDASAARMAEARAVAAAARLALPDRAVLVARRDAHLTAAA